MKLIAQRKFDELGRIVIPCELRIKLHLNGENLVNVYEDNNNIVISAPEHCCKLCGSICENNNTFGICSSCIEKIKNIC